MNRRAQKSARNDEPEQHVEHFDQGLRGANEVATMNASVVRSKTRSA